MLVLVGTRKGGFLLHSDDSRSTWSLEGPLFAGWKVTAGCRAADGRYLVATASDVYGAAVQRSADLERWEQPAPGPAFPAGGDRRLNNIWTLHAAGETLLAGVDDAGLFRSDDWADTWQPVTGLNEHPTAGRWSPGFGGLAAHAVLTDPAEPSRMWCGISAVGVFRSDDGGASW